MISFFFAYIHFFSVNRISLTEIFHGCRRQKKSRKNTAIIKKLLLVARYHVTINWELNCCFEELESPRKQLHSDGIRLLFDGIRHLSVGLRLRQRSWLSNNLCSQYDCILPNRFLFLFIFLIRNPPFNFISPPHPITSFPLFPSFTVRELSMSKYYEEMFKYTRITNL